MFPRNLLQKIYLEETANALTDKDVLMNTLFGLIGGGFRSGGRIFGEGGPISDSIPAMVSNGEYVVKADSAKKIGYDNLAHLIGLASFLCMLKVE